MKNNPPPSIPKLQFRSMVDEASDILFEQKDIDRAIEMIDKMIDGRKIEWGIITPDKCPKCGAEIEPEQEYCFKCGEEFLPEPLENPFNSVDELFIFIDSSDFSTEERVDLLMRWLDVKFKEEWELDFPLPPDE